MLLFMECPWNWASLSYVLSDCVSITELALLVKVFNTDSSTHMFEYKKCILQYRCRSRKSRDDWHKEHRSRSRTREVRHSKKRKSRSRSRVRERESAHKRRKTRPYDNDDAYRCLYLQLSNPMFVGLGQRFFRIVQ